MSLAPIQYSQTLGELLSLDGKLRSQLPAELEKQLRAAEKECERRPFGKPKRPVVFMVPLMAFVITWLTLALLMLLFSLTGRFSEYFVLACIAFLPLLLKTGVSALFGDPLPLPDKLTFANIRGWAGTKPNLWFYGQLLLAFVFVALVVAVVFLVIDIVRKSAEYRQLVDAYPKTAEEFEKYEDERQARAKAELARLRQEAPQSGQYRERFESLADYIGLPEEYRDAGCLKALKKYIDTGKAHTLNEALELYRQAQAQAREQQ